MKNLEGINLAGHGLTENEKKLADEELVSFRKARLRGYSEQEELFARLTQLRYKIEDFISAPIDEVDMNNRLNFGSFLSQYIKVLNRKQEDFAKEIDLHATKLSRIINNRDEPNQKLFFRLEIHSGLTIPALIWWKCYTRQNEQKLIRNVSAQLHEATHVKNRLKFEM